MRIRLLLPTKSFRQTLLNHFISKVVHDLFSLQREVLENGTQKGSKPGQNSCYVRTRARGT